MTIYYIQILILLFLLLFQPVEVLLTPKRYGIKHSNSFTWTLLMSLITVTTTSFQPFENSMQNVALMAMFLLILIGAATSGYYFSGQLYHIADVTGLNLKVILKKAVESAGLIIEATEVVEDNKKSTLKIIGSKKKIEIELKEKFLTNQTYYQIKFGRWLDRKSKDLILDYISEHLSQFELPEKKKRYVIVESVLFMGILVVLLGTLNTKLLQETSYAVFEEGMPEMMEVTIFDKRITDVKENQTFSITNPEVLKAFYDAFSDAEMWNYRNLQPGNLNENAYFLVRYGDLQQSIYVMNSGSYLYIPYDEIEEVSPLKKFMVSFYRLYGKKEGIYYSLYYDFDELTYARELLAR